MAKSDAHEVARIAARSPEHSRPNHQPPEQARRPSANDRLKRGRNRRQVLEHHAPIRPPEQLAEHRCCHDRILQRPGDGRLRDAIQTTASEDNSTMTATAQRATAIPIPMRKPRIADPGYRRLADTTNASGACTKGAIAVSVRSNCARREIVEPPPRSLHAIPQGRGSFMPSAPPRRRSADLQGEARRSPSRKARRATPSQAAQPAASR